jgi:hypothetical protein
VSAFKMAFFKLLYEKNTVLAFFFNSFMKKNAETAFFHIILWKNTVFIKKITEMAFFFTFFMKKMLKQRFFVLFHGKMPFWHFFSILL